MVKTPSPNAYVEQLVKASGTSFYAPLAQLPKEKRRAMMALYAFCRLVDDAVDNERDEQKALNNLTYWRGEIGAIYHEAALPEHPAMQALQHAVRKFNLPKKHFLDIIAGVEMDAVGLMRKPNEAALEQYCYRVAGCVGLLSIEIFGYTDPKAKEFAVALGHAMQLTNILRDLKEDAAMGRIYLPIELLTACGLGDVLASELIHHPKLPLVCMRLGRRAQRYFRVARGTLPRADMETLKPALAMQKIYERYLAKMAQQDWHLVNKRVRLNWLDKARLLLSN